MTRSMYFPARSQRRAWPIRTLIRRVLVSAQVAIAVMLVIGAGLFVRSLHNALSTDVGFRANRLAFATVSLSGARYDQDEAARFYESLVTRLNSVPGVERATFGGLPLAAFSMSTPVVRIGAETKQLPRNMTDATSVGPDYFRTLGVQVLKGRDFNSRDTQQSEPVIIVSAALARTLWPGQDAIGKDLTFLPMRHNARVVGVVADLKYSNLRESDRHAMSRALAAEQIDRSRNHRGSNGITPRARFCRCSGRKSAGSIGLFRSRRFQPLKRRSGGS